MEAAQRFVTAQNQLAHTAARITSQRIDRLRGNQRGAVAVAERVDHRDQRAVVKGLDQVAVARLGLARQRRRRDPPIQGWRVQFLHLVTVTVVPSWRFDTI
jgi:hypothetical protein